MLLVDIATSLHLSSVDKRTHLTFNEETSSRTFLNSGKLLRIIFWTACWNIATSHSVWYTNTGISRELVLTNSQILSTLYTGTNGTVWTSNTNWMDGDPCLNAWYGVTCNGSVVTSLTLGGNGLSGSLPSQLGSLGAMIYFASDNNRLTGFVPSELGLMQLESLCINYCSFSGSLPSQLGGLSGLTARLHLQANLFTGSIPSQFGLLSLMTLRFYLFSNSLSGGVFYILLLYSHTHVYSFFLLSLSLILSYTFILTHYSLYPSTPHLRNLSLTLSCTVATWTTHWHDFSFQIQFKPAFKLNSFTVRVVDTDDKCFHF